MSIKPEGRKLLRVEARNAEVPIERSRTGLRLRLLWDPNITR